MESSTDKFSHDKSSTDYQQIRERSGSVVECLTSVTTFCP